MKKHILCYLGWHKWSEQKYSIVYRRSERRYQTAHVSCLRQLCERVKSFERRV